MQIREYVRASDLEEAYRLLQMRNNNRIIGGCTFLKRTGLRIGTAVDLSGCGLDYIQEKDGYITVGAMTSLREIETSERLKYWYGDALSQATEHLIGVQLRNSITIGGHVASRYGFSDIIPTLLSLNAVLRFYHRGTITLEEYMELSRPQKDILIELLLPEVETKVCVKMMRKSYGDYSVFCLSCARAKEQWTIAAGALPSHARLAKKTMETMNHGTVRKSDAARLAESVTDEFVFGTNYRGSAEYRRELCRVFAKRSIEELADDDSCNS